MDISECIEKGYLRKIEPDKKIIEKEINESMYDLEKAKKALSDNDFKWAIIKSYYSMFHAARAVLFSVGYREKRHFAVQVFLEDLAKEGRIESVFVDYFSFSMESREDADYKYIYTEETASDILEYAEIFIERMKALLSDYSKKNPSN